MYKSLEVVLGHWKPMARLMACESSGESLVLRIYRSFCFSKESKSNCDPQKCFEWHFFDNLGVLRPFTSSRGKSQSQNMIPGNWKSGGKDFTNVGITWTETVSILEQSWSKDIQWRGCRWIDQISGRRNRLDYLDICLWYRLWWKICFKIHVWVLYI